MSNIILVGAWGTGMSGIAAMLCDLWYTNIVGIDSTHSQLTDNNEKKGVKMIYQHGQYKVQPWDHIIYSAAADQSPEVLQAQQIAQTYTKGMIVANYFEFLWEISKYFQTVWFAWTNGKSSTTGLAIYAAKQTINEFGLGILWAIVPDLNNQSYYIDTNKKTDIRNIFDNIFTGKWLNYNLIKKYYFFVEACEYKRHFLHLDMDYMTITSLELDHTDYYKDLEDYVSAYEQCIRKSKKKVYISNDIQIPTQWDQDIQKKIHKVQTNNWIQTWFFGSFNQENCSLVDAILQQIQVDTQKNNTYNPIDIRKDFKGLRRRMENIGSTKKWATIYSDYAHMASSIQALHKALRKKFPEKKLVAIFQPHQLKRITQSRDDFTQILQQFDVVYIYDIYAARENIQEIKINNQKTYTSIQEFGDDFAKHIKATYIQDIQTLRQNIENYDTNYIITAFTAGDLDYKLRWYYQA